MSAHSTDQWLIRPETAGDHEAVRTVNVDAFDTSAEAGLVDTLREQADPVVSLVADQNGGIVGHILFTPVKLTGYPNLRLMGLAPMAVAREHQRKGIGSALVDAGLEVCGKLGAIAVVVLGHPEYYPRFGFAPASTFGIDSEYDVPEEVFMIVELQAGALQRRSGTIKYHAAFAIV